jgi:5-methylcytosine-specific restriction endonuclease McrA
VPSTPGGICHRCSRRAVTGSKLCSDHQDSANDHKRQYDRYRSDDPIRKLYKSRRWLKGTRLIVLRRDILCKSCGHRVATDVDHILSARLVIDNFGHDAFFDPDRCQGLCHACHSAKTSLESGWVNRNGTKLTEFGDRSNMTIVCGPGGAGKSTYVAEHKADDDLIWDYDAVMHEITGLPMHEELHGATGSVLANRDQWIQATEHSTKHCWLIVSNAKAKIVELLQAVGARVIVLETDEAECQRRLAARFDAVTLAK